MSRKQFTLTEEQRKSFAGVYLLDVIINVPAYFSVLLEGNDKDLEPVLDWLMVKEYVQIKDNEKYVPTAKGRAVLQNFKERYLEFLKVFDIYCAVDLEAGEFAFSYYFDFDNMDEWRAFLQDERWEDLRIAVADYKGIDPVEIVFMSFIHENRFGRDETGWQFDLLLGTVWDEILEICNTALLKDDLAYEDEHGYVSGEDVIEDIITQGTELMIELYQKDEQFNVPDETPVYEAVGDNGHGDELVVEKVVMIPYPVDYYYPYRDPRYLRPIWRRRWLI
ncbi:MAG: hypothetical protein D6675_15500 [Gemmatimonadetes bacterium]|nr:MAG: hypothetical protein D6675_15500 [Gemmatimonadota bacterium]